MKINKIKLITFSTLFSVFCSFGSGCYYNAKRSPTTNEPTNKTTANEQIQKKETLQPQNKSDRSVHNLIDSETDTYKTNNNLDNELKKSSSNIINKCPANSPDESSVVIGPIIQGENMIPSARKYSTPVKEVTQMIKNPSISKKKIVFLTFDDGPDISKTPKILNILKVNNVHATFFILGSRLQNQTNKNILTQTYKSGNAIANHSYSHNMKAIYPQNTLCIPTFMSEVNLTNSMLKDILGPKFDCAVLRMPGGYNSREYYNDRNIGALTKILDKKGVISIDWNAENGDAVKGDKSVSSLLANVQKYSTDKKVVVLLMHDISNNTVQALPQIIKYYKNNGYEFRVISN